METARYIVGIDLGTTHSVVAYAHANTSDDEQPQIHLLDIPQVVSPGEVQGKTMLPSFLFLPGPHDVGEGDLALPWYHDMPFAVGEFARKRGAERPARLVSSAKSWLCHTGVDRTQAILPWDAPTDTERVSPLEAMTRYLNHLRDAWNHQMAREDEGARLEHQPIFLTVPASFDAMARELTVQAARSAGLHNLTLLEEPTAAFYAWIQAQDEGWRDQINVGESILVCDIGGGTTDLSLIEVVDEDGNLELRRVAVGDHILLGGDNMDLTLAYAVRGKLAQQGTRLDNWQFRSLWHSCRKAKERLLSNPDLDAEPVVILGRGSSLIGGTIRTELTRTEIESILVQGFFPTGEFHELPQRKPRVGVREMGLPYESDPAITRHLAAFLNRQVNQGDGATGVAFPSSVLFNGGVMKADALRTQVVTTLNKWHHDSNISELPSVNLDLAVALGATYYGLARAGKGIRIKAGTAQSYYIGVESAMPAVPGIPTPVNALCVVPFGMEEGTQAEVRGKEFGLVVGEPAVFHLLGTTNRKEDAVGYVIEDWDGDLLEVATLDSQIDVGEDESGTVIPVYLESHVTEIGTLEIWCVSRDDDRRWKLEFNLRDTHEEAEDFSL